MIDYDDLKKSNPQLYKVIMLGKAVRTIPEADKFITGIGKKFPIKEADQKNMLLDALSGFVISAGIKAVGESVSKRIAKRKRQLNRKGSGYTLLWHDYFNRSV
jgi:hypothetical protein